jgi:hypothetical protein
MPDSHWWRPIGSRHYACRVMGWSNDHHWFYYIAPDVGGGSPPYRVGRTDANLSRNEILIDDVSEGHIYLTSNAQYIVFQNTYSDAAGDVQRDWFSISTSGQNLQNLTAQFGSRTDGTGFGQPFFSPQGDWLVMRVSKWDGSQRSYHLYKIALDGSAVEEIPGFEAMEVEILQWTATPEWLVLYNPSTGETYKVRPDGSDLTLLTSGYSGTVYSVWTHQSGMVGLFDLATSTFSAVSVDTEETLWELKDVQKVYKGMEAGDPKKLDTSWVHFMIGGRLARCRLDGSDLAFFDTQNLSIRWIWGWTPDHQWVWLETFGNNSNLTDLIRVQADTGKTEVLLDEVSIGFLEWVPDGESAYFYDYQNSNNYGIKVNGSSKAELVPVQGALPVGMTPPYEAEWQPARTLIIGNGLMSVSILSSIVLWRRKKGRGNNKHARGTRATNNFE